MKLCIASMAVVLLALVAVPAIAQQTIYENGPINGTIDAWTINFGFAVSDTFKIITDTDVESLHFGAWLEPGDILENADVGISSSEFGGTIYFDGLVNFTQSGCSANQYGYNVCTESGTFPSFDLNPGTYWLTLSNAVVNTGDPIFWDENSGVGCHSPGCPSLASENSVGTIPSEAFTVDGTPTVPEPSSILLFGSGVLGLAGLLRRKLF